MAGALKNHGSPNYDLRYGVVSFTQLGNRA